MVPGPRGYCQECADEADAGYRGVSEGTAGECGRDGCAGYKPDHDHELAF